VILSVCASGSGEHDRPTGTSEQRDRVSERPSEKRERVLLSEREWPSAVRERVVSEGETSNNNVRLR
jgi:hypothetical protein